MAKHRLCMRAEYVIWVNGDHTRVLRSWCQHEYAGEAILEHSGGLEPADVVFCDDMPGKARRQIRQHYSQRLGKCVCMDNIIFLFCFSKHSTVAQVYLEGCGRAMGSHVRFFVCMLNFGLIFSFFCQTDDLLDIETVKLARKNETCESERENEQRGENRERDERKQRHLTGKEKVFEPRRYRLCSDMARITNKLFQKQGCSGLDTFATCREHECKRGFGRAKIAREKGMAPKQIAETGLKTGALSQKAIVFLWCWAKHRMWGRRWMPEADNGGQRKLNNK